MSPYLRAHEVYHRHGEPGVPWLDALDFHLQAGLVISDHRRFLMARPVDPAVEDLATHLDLAHVLAVTQRGTWHVWAASGPLSSFLDLINRYDAAAISWQRRGGAVHLHPAGYLHAVISGLVKPNRSLLA